MSHGAVCPPALPHNVSLPSFFFLMQALRTGAKQNQPFTGVEEARIVISEGAVLQTTISWR